MSTKRVHPLHLPEIRTCIASFLNKNDLVSCILVCHAWKASMLPFIWQSINLTPELAHTRLAFETHAHHIRSLFLSGFRPLNPSLFKVATFTRLTNLRLFMGTNGFSVQVLQHCPVLTRLEIHCRLEDEENDLRMESVLRVIRDGCPLLRSLTLFRFLFSKEGMDVFLDICARLSFLWLRGTRLLEVSWGGRDATLLGSNRGGGGGGGELDFSSLQSLHLSLDSSVLLSFLGRLSGIQTLVISFNPQNSGSPSDLARFVEEGSFPHLNDLAITDQEAKMKDSDLARILRSMRVCKQFSLNDARLGPKAMEELVRHCPTLEVLVIRQFADYYAGEELVAKVLDSCSKLRKLYVDQVASKMVMMDNGSWACVELTDFEGRIVEEDHDHRNRYYSQEPIFERLATLTKMQSFRFDSHDHRFGVVGYRILVDLRQGYGVEMLSGWKDLQEVSFQGVPQDLEMADVEWMVEHWTSLKTVTGVLNGDEEIQEELEEYLVGKGIEYDVGFRPGYDEEYDDL